MRVLLSWGTLGQFRGTFPTMTGTGLGKRARGSFGGSRLGTIGFGFFIYGFTS